MDNSRNIFIIVDAYNKAVRVVIRATETTRDKQCGAKEIKIIWCNSYGGGREQTGNEEKAKKREQNATNPSPA